MKIEFIEAKHKIEARVNIELGKLYLMNSGGKIYLNPSRDPIIVPLMSSNKFLSGLIKNLYKIKTKSYLYIFVDSKTEEMGLAYV